MRLAPEVIFVAFVPPFLYWAAFTTSLREFRRALWPIVRLGVLLVLVMIGAVTRFGRTPLGVRADARVRAFVEARYHDALTRGQHTGYVPIMIGVQF